ncbi:MAG TPA: TlpA disulfide reductase family protein [Polyangiaceae bacterium]|jgi:peroxiredoxin
MNLPRELSLVALVGALGALGACGSQSTSAPASTEGAPSTAAGTLAPDFTGRDIDGKTFRLSDHLGKDVVLLDFWSTYCEPCKAEFPHLRAMYDGQRTRGLLVVGVAMDGPETVADVPSFVKRFELDFPVVTDEDSRIASLFNPKKSMPLSVLIDKGGRIVAVREGYAPGDEKLVAADVDKALGAPTPAP